MQDVTYYDDLGRPMQMIQLRAAPGAAKDIVVPITYDNFGRQDRDYLPFATATGAGGGYKWGATVHQAAFYNTPPQGVVQIAASSGVTPSFSQRIYEASPLDRVMEQGFPGQVWQPGPSRTPATGRTAVTTRTTNNMDPFESTATTRMVTRYIVVGGPTPNSEGIYAGGELYVAIHRDENWQDYGASDFRSRLHTTEEYTDKQGRVVLTRTFEQNGSTENMLSTYYVYNDLGQLCFVLPPGLNPDRIYPPPPRPRGC
ncbi:DUF6443 domain-containing protein [Sphingobacterium olei]|uniref:DUF6443 domain-containing protein n=1 Tax=Sphingobacterium olei TaxID=2571155 RepID=UPI0021CE47BE|nr:DUF6443 domain-containing protein [Sphingobacterium olei]